jgi:Hemerythrin HHE cation binding domain
MKHPQDKTQMTPCDGPLPELEVPMINTMVACLGIEHRKLNDLIMQLACAATRLANDPGAVTANERALQVRDEIQHALRSHLQIEDGLVSWGKEHRAISGALLDIVQNEPLEMRKAMAALRALSSGVDHEPQTAEDRSGFAQTLLALARALDSHVERYDAAVLPSILRALSHQ